MEKIVKDLREIKIKVFYDEDKSENPLKVKFPNLSYGEDYENREEIMDKLEKLEIINEKEDYLLTDKYYKINDKLGEKISVGYFKRNMKICSIFNEKEDLLDMDSDTFWHEFEKSDSDSASLSDFDSDSDLDPDSDEYINREIARDKDFEKFVRKDIYERFV